MSTLELVGLAMITGPLLIAFVGMLVYLVGGLLYEMWHRERREFWISLVFILWFATASVLLLCGGLPYQ